MKTYHYHEVRARLERMKPGAAEAYLLQLAEDYLQACGHGEMQLDELEVQIHARRISLRLFAERANDALHSIEASLELSPAQDGVWRIAG